VVALTTSRPDRPIAIGAVDQRCPGRQLRQHIKKSPARSQPNRREPCPAPEFHLSLRAVLEIPPAAWQGLTGRKNQLVLVDIRGLLQLLAGMQSPQHLTSERIEELLQIEHFNQAVILPTVHLEKHLRSPQRLTEQSGADRRTGGALRHGNRLSEAAALQPHAAEGVAQAGEYDTVRVMAPLQIEATPAPSSQRIRPVQPRATADRGPGLPCPAAGPERKGESSAQLAGDGPHLVQRNSEGGQAVLAQGKAT